MRIYKNGRKKLLFDPCRQIFLEFTPEEEVRQKILHVLMDDMEIPRDSISTEFALPTGQRADIVVWHKDRNGNEHALLVIEVKAQHIELTDHTLEQVKSYNNILKAKYIGIANGRDMQLYDNQGNESVPLVNELYSYMELLKGNVEYTSYRQMQRLPYNLTSYNRYIQHLKHEGYIGEGTPITMHPFISELQNYILCGEIQVSGNYRSKISEDLSYGVYSFGNAGGGSFPGYYRSFIVKDFDDKFGVYRIGVFGTSVLNGDPVYGNRQGNTYLTVAKDESGSTTNILQLNLDKFCIYSEGKNTFDISHNGRRNGFTNLEVLENVTKYSPDLIINERVYLGTLPANSTITSNLGSELIERLIEYACIRAKLKTKRKGKKRN
jgi:hypothetical protein